MTKVYKFGGASLKNAEALRNMRTILQEEGHQQNLLVIVSAMGKTTNALENLLKNYWESKNYQNDLSAIKQYHFEILNELFSYPSDAIFTVLEDCFGALEYDLTRRDEQKEYNKMYDTIIAYGELFSSLIVQHFLYQKIPCQWMDARQFIKTDSTWREARINWLVTEKQIQLNLPVLLSKQILITQGFIGSNEKGETTTLGREGSDFSGAIFAYCLEAIDFTIWKDVAGVLNADPKRFSDAQLFSNLSYQEALKMTYYGASVIHPKTIAPLAEKEIPLLVKSFLHPQQVGTVISTQPNNSEIPSLIIQDNQVLIHFQAKKIIFLQEEDIFMLMEHIIQANVRTHFFFKTATTLSICTDNRPEKIQQIKALSAIHFEIEVEENLSLLTIIRPDEDAIRAIASSLHLKMIQKNETLFQAIFQ